MEDNIAQALKLAAFTLMFVSALAIAISSFSSANETLQIVLEYSDRENDYSYVEENLDASGNSVTDRIVSAETIMPTIMRAFVENYKIYFLDDDGDIIELYSYVNDDGTKVPSNFIDLEAQTLGNTEQKENFITGILYGNGALTDSEKVPFTNLRITFTDSGIYGIINENKFYEYLGEYYQDDLIIDGLEIDTSSVPETNKTKKRIITYVQI